MVATVMSCPALYLPSEKEHRLIVVIICLTVRGQATKVLANKQNNPISLDLAHVASRSHPYIKRSLHYVRPKGFRLQFCCKVKDGGLTHPPIEEGRETSWLSSTLSVVILLSLPILRGKTLSRLVERWRSLSEIQPSISSGNSPILFLHASKYIKCFRLPISYKIKEGNNI